MTPLPQGGDLADLVLSLLPPEGAQVVVTQRAHVNQRWARSSATTNGVTHSTLVTVILQEHRTKGVATASLTSNVQDESDVRMLVERARAGLADSRSEEPVGARVASVVDADFDATPPDLTVDAIAAALGQLGDFTSELASDGIESFGYVEREQSTRWLATSDGLRRRSVEIQDRLEITAKSHDRTRSTWHGQASLDLHDDHELAERIRRELAWQATRIDVEPGRHTVVLTPSAVADLCVDLLWSSGARDAVEGRTALHDAKGSHGTRLGQRLIGEDLEMFSDPTVHEYPMMATTPFALTEASGRYASVLDNGRTLGRQEWFKDGVLRGLHGPTGDGAALGFPVCPVPGNLIVRSRSGAGRVEDLVATVEHGLLVTCLWYIRAVDPQTMTVTGLTRDGVYCIRDGRIVGAASNFRFNDSPLGLLKRLSMSGASERTLPREMADDANRTVVPPMVVRDLHLTSRSDAV